MELGMQVCLAPGYIVLDADPAPPPPKGHSPQIFGPYLLWPNGLMDQDGTWHVGRPRPRPHCVGWGPISPSPEKGADPPAQFLAHVYCGHMARCIRIPLGTEVGLGPGDIVRWGPSTAPQFLDHVYCGQRAGWIKMPLGTHPGSSLRYRRYINHLLTYVSLGPCHIVLDGDLPSRKGHSSPSPFFGPCLLLPWSPISAAAELLFAIAKFLVLVYVKSVA